MKSGFTAGTIWAANFDVERRSLLLSWHFGKMSVDSQEEMSSQMVAFAEHLGLRDIQTLKDGNMFNIIVYSNSQIERVQEFKIS